MNKISLSHGQSAVPMNLFATWEVDRSSPHSIPRVCNISLGKLLLVREFDRDAQSFFLAVRMQGSKRVLRSNEIALPGNENLMVELELTFSLQYSHFLKRDGNILQIMLQRKKRYKNRAILGYKTLAVGTLDLANIIQSPITDESPLDLISTNKDRGGISVQAQVVISSAHSTPADEGDVPLEQPEKRHGAGRLHEVDNYTDDEETFSSEQEMYLDEDNPDKQKERRKHRLSSSSRQQNFIKAKLIALLRRFKQGEDEGLEEEMGHVTHENVPDEEELDFLYNQIEDLNLSDSCPEVEDNISILSTPKPKLRPFFDRMSHSSSQTEISSLKDTLNGDRIEPVEEAQDSRMSSPHIYIPAIDRSDSSDPEDYPSHNCNAQEHSFYGDEDSSFSQSGGASQFSQVFRDQGINENLTKSYPPEANTPHKKADQYGCSAQVGSHDTIVADAKSPYSLPFLHGSFTSGEEETDRTQSVLGHPIVLISTTDRKGCYLEESFQTYLQSGNNINAVIVTTTSRHQLRTVFVYLTTRLQKLLSSNSMPPGGVKIVLAGTDSYFNLVLQQFIEFLSSRSPEWMTYFLFLLVPLGKTKLGQYLASLDSHYGRLFSDQAWYDAFERTSFSISHSPHVPSSTSQINSALGNHDRNTSMMVIRRILEYIDRAVSTLPLSIAEAMLTFGEKSENEGSSQKFVPFISEAKVFLLQVDSDREDGAGAIVTSNASHSPSLSLNNPGSASINTTNSHSASLSSQDTKMGLQVDYWKDRDLAKYTLKTNFKSFVVSKLPPSGERVGNPNLSLDVVTVGKKNIMRLPGKKGKERETDSKSSVIPSISRVICTSKHQQNLLKVKIDGIEWSEVKFFQLSSFWSSHIKTFPVGLFPS